MESVVNAYLRSIDEEAPGLIEGLYLTGSVALGEFRASTSDIDFLAVRDTYSFYNPVQHPELARSGGREIFFEGTLSAAFAEPRPTPIPRYDYNQMVYRLDLDDPRLFLPVAIYRVPGATPRYRTRDALPADASGA